MKTLAEAKEYAKRMGGQMAILEDLIEKSERRYTVVYTVNGVVAIGSGKRCVCFVGEVDQ